MFELNWLLHRPGKTVGDPVVHDLRPLKYSPSGIICYKLSFDVSEWSELPRANATRQSSEPENWVRKFSEPFQIKEIKFRDLQAMKSVLPTWAHSYYDSLPHS